MTDNIVIIQDGAIMNTISNQLQAKLDTVAKEMIDTGSTEQAIDDSGMVLVRSDSESYKQRVGVAQLIITIDIGGCGFTLFSK